MKRILCQTHLRFSRQSKRKKRSLRMFPNLLFCGTWKRTVRSRNVTIQQQQDICTFGAILKIETTFFSETMLKTFTTLYGVTSQKTVLSTVTALRASLHRFLIVFIHGKAIPQSVVCLSFGAVRAMETLKWMSVEPSMSRCFRVVVLCRLKFPTHWYSHKKVPTSPPPQKKYNN